MKPRNTGSSNSNTDRTPVPSGTHFSRIVSVVFAGAIEGYYQGKKTDARDKLIISYELCHKMRKGKDDIDIPFVISKEYAFFYGGTAHLRKDIEALLERQMTEAEHKDNEFEPASLLGKAASITVIHNVSAKNGKTYVNAKTVAAVPETYRDGLPQPVRPLVNFDITKFTDLQTLLNDPVYKELNKFLKGKVNSSIDYKTLVDEANPQVTNTTTTTTPTNETKQNENPFPNNGADDLPF